MLAGSTLQQSGLRLPALALILGGVRAVVNAIDVRTSHGELLRHEFMDGMHDRFREDSSADPRLIGHDDNR
jgi:hypothetical protein